MLSRLHSRFLRMEKENCLDNGKTEDLFFKRKKEMF